MKGLVEGTCLREGDEDRVDKDALCSENATLVAECLREIKQLLACKRIPASKPGHVCVSSKELEGR